MATPSVSNRKARFNYEILEKFTAGMVLLGPEIKSIRQGKASIAEAYCHLTGEVLWVRNMSVSPYEEAGDAQADGRRDRKLLLKRTELKKIGRKLKDAGITIIPLKLFLSDKGWAKIEIALARGKKIYDKREDIRKRDVDRQLSKVRKSRTRS